MRSTSVCILFEQVGKSMMRKVLLQHAEIERVKDRIGEEWRER